MTQTLKKTPLHDLLSGKGKFIPFAGWLMPVEFQGIVTEHQIVRSSAGLFDLSHMGEIEVRGGGALDVLQSLVTNDVSRLEVGAALYTPVCKEDGGILDDVLVYRLEDYYMVVVNASNIEKMLGWFNSHAGGQCRFTDRSSDTSLIALQGPEVEPRLQPLTSTPLAELKYYHHTRGKVGDVPCLISRTGYTGEDGFELYVDNHDATHLWHRLVEQTHAQPIGLGARDTLRLESRFALYGNDIDETTNPLEAGLGWTVKLDKGEFIGRTALQDVKSRGVSRHLVGIQMESSGVPRHGFEVQKEGAKVGHVTSGTFSPSLNEAIGLAYVQTGLHQTGTELDVVIRTRPARARVVKTPFYKGSVKRG